MPLSKEMTKQIAGLEVNALNYSQTIPDDLEGGRIITAGTPIYDINGEILFRRYPIKRNRDSIGYADVAVNEILGEPLLAVSTGVTWDQREIRKEAIAAAERLHPSLKFGRVRFVAYSYPKIALQFLKGKREVLMLEWKTWAEVPPQQGDRQQMQPSNFERWSLIDEMPAARKRSNTRSFNNRMNIWDSAELSKVDMTRIRRRPLERYQIVVNLTDTQEVHYNDRSVDHHICYELRGQQTGVWCVAASVEMLLNFYRYHYSQIRLADELNLGTCASPNGLPYANVGDVVTVIENLTSNNLDTTMHVNPTWNIFRNEIQANRPLISFIPGHSRTVAGYTQSLIHLPGNLPFKGLLVYDPWPPTDCNTPNAGGVITKWENFATQTYQYAYSAVLKQI